MKLIKFNKTIVGWYNFTVMNVVRWNVDPETFRRYAGVSEQATMGTCEITTEDLEELQAKAKFIGFAEGWEEVDYEIVVEEAEAAGTI